MKIYTKTGDKGKTSLFGGKRVSKKDCRIDVCGEIDELNSVVGITISQIKNEKLKMKNYKEKIKNELINVQKDLFEIGSTLASSKRLNQDQGSTLKKRTGELEELIDQMEEELPRLKNFILPGGGELGSTLHLARAVCRRAERNVTAVTELSIKNKVLRLEIKKNIIPYLNRLSDLLFVMARFANFKEKKKEIVWSK